MLCALTWYRKLSTVPGLSRKLNGRSAVSFIGEAVCGYCWKTISDESSEFPRQGKPTLCCSCVHNRNVPLSPWQQPIHEHPKEARAALWEAVVQVGVGVCVGMEEGVSHQLSPSCLRLACSWGRNVYT